MRLIVCCIISLFLNYNLCFSQSTAHVSKATVEQIIELRKNMESYVEESTTQAKYWGYGRNEQIKKLLNYVAIIEGSLDTLVAVLQGPKSDSNYGHILNLTPPEIQKFIDYILERLKIMQQDLANRQHTTNDALMIHSLRRVTDIFNQTLSLLQQARNEITRSK